jgi:YD repeat-containing protein
VRLGFAMTSYMYNERRTIIARRSFASLCKTNVAGLEKPALQLIYHEPRWLFESYIEELSKTWEVYVEEEKPIKEKTWETFGVYGAQELLNKTDITHIGFLADDFVYNPGWMQQLVLLINRHPDGKAWSVYRSGYTRHHRIIGGDGVDVLMTMHDATGTMTRQEWDEYGASTRKDFTCPPSMGGGCTIDIHHAFIRPGNRWATSKDYWQNIDPHNGIETEDVAIDFIGE